MYIDTGNKTECFGCEACVQICHKKAISMKEDEEGFRYPVIDMKLCINCSLCREVCPYNHMPAKYKDSKYVFGGYHLNKKIRFESTSGGAFSAILDAFCDKNYVVFGVEARKLKVFHNYITDKSQLEKFRKSKYSQSIIGNSYKKAKKFLIEGKKVLFSGTPCQIAGLRVFLGEIDQTNLLTVEVVCEGVPSPYYIQKYEKYLKKKYGTDIKSLDYRYTGKGIFSQGKWDFQQMKIILFRKKQAGFRRNNKKIIIKDRWLNSFWHIWLNHLMSRPSCYQCPFAETGRIADISLGDLWGVHRYCPELYGNNIGSSLIVANTEKGKEVVKKAQTSMYGHILKFEDALKYQSPMRHHINNNLNREKFMSDLKSDMDYIAINKKWAKKPTIKLLWQKYIWGNRQKIFIWNLKQRRKRAK